MKTGKFYTEGTLPWSPDPTELLNCALDVGLGEMTGEEIKAELHELGTSSEEVYSKFLEFVRLGIVARNRGRIDDARAEILDDDDPEDKNYLSWERTTPAEGE